MGGGRPLDGGVEGAGLLHPFELLRVPGMVLQGGACGTTVMGDEATSGCARGGAAGGRVVAGAGRRTAEAAPGLKPPGRTKVLAVPGATGAGAGWCVCAIGCGAGEDEVGG